MPIDSLPVCRDEQQRRADVLANPDINGIDFLEVDPLDHSLLRVFFLKPVPPLNAADPSDVNDIYGLSTDLTRTQVSGGIRIVGIRPVSVTRRPEGHLQVQLTVGGDFSTYTITFNAPGLDPVLRSTAFSFMASCPVDIDCRAQAVCPPPVATEPALDYLAKDFSSFRRMMLDLVPQLNPDFIERNPSDLGIALVELLAYTGDHLSYFQDAVANEAYLETLRHRVSARRHARLVDYRMHDGRNAWTWIHVAVNGDTPLPQGTPFVSRIFSPLRGFTAPPGPVIDSSVTPITAELLESDPTFAGVVVFESSHPVALQQANNEMRIHSWGNEECCLDTTAHEVYLYSVLPGTSTASLPSLRNGDYLLFEEVRGPLTGLPADADPAHRQVVRIDEDPEPTSDPVYSSILVDDQLQRRTGADPELPLLRVHWRREDALAFPVCLSARVPGTELIRNITVARCNLVLADHGLTTSETVALADPVPGDTPFRLGLSRGPLTKQVQPPQVSYDPITARLQTERTDLTGDANSAQAAVALLVTFPTGEELWTPVPDLLDSTPFGTQFVAEVEDDGRALLRFGDGEYGREPAGATAFEAVYRIGNGTTGNVGSEAMAHIASPAPLGTVELVRNPLAATGGIAAETIEEVRRRAPQAFRAEQFRAVTAADYAAAAVKLPEVAGAAADFRWTGSWYTVFVAIDPRDPEDLIRRPQGLAVLSPSLEQKVRTFLTRYRLAGYDLEIRPPTFVPIELDLQLCVDPQHFRADVVEAVREAMSNRRLPDGTLGFFHPDNFTFGQSVYLSRIYAAVERVEGVESVTITKFLRAGKRDNGELLNSVMKLGPWEVALLDNDPNFLENGILRITAFGGKG